jgi:hypothetical protein
MRVRKEKTDITPGGFGYNSQETGEMEFILCLSLGSDRNSCLSLGIMGGKVLITDKVTANSYMRQVGSTWSMLP